MKMTQATNVGGDDVADVGHPSCKVSTNGHVESFLFDDPDHDGFLLEKLNTLRKDKLFCDVILQVGSHQDVHEIYAHRSILAAASPYFLEMFQQDSLNTPLVNPIQQYKLLSGNYDPEAFEYIIDYIYTGHLEIPKGAKVNSVYAVANRLKLTSVAHQCGQFLALTLTPDNCLTVRIIPGVMSDPILLNSVDNYVRQNVRDICSTRSMELLPKIQIEVIQNSREEREATNQKHLFDMVLDWIRKYFDTEKINMPMMTEKVYMLYLNAEDKTLHDCTEIEPGDLNNSDMIEDYRKLSRRLSVPAKQQSNGKTNGHSNNQVAKQNPSKPKNFLFTRSDSDSSLSSIADDDDTDWKVLATHSTADYTVMGLVMIGGKLSALTVKLRINSPTNTPDVSRDHSIEKSGSYTMVQPMSCARCAVGAANFRGKLFVCGGYDRGECKRTVEVYDEAKNKWSELAPMKVSRGRFDVTVIDDNIYAIGGSDGHQELNSAEVFDATRMEWRSLPSCPVARSTAGVCNLNGHVYVVGGWNGTRGLNRTDVFSPVTELWSEVASLKNGRYQAGVVALNDEIYAVGGCDSWVCLNVVEKYSAQTLTWQTIAPLSISRRGCGVVAYKGLVYAIGGHDGTHSLCSVEIYDPATNTWSVGPSLTKCRANVGVAVVGEKVYAVGGFNGKVFLNSIEFLDPKENEWTMIVSKENEQSNSSNSSKNVENNGGIPQYNHSMSTFMSEEALVEVEGEELNTFSE